MFLFSLNLVTFLRQVCNSQDEIIFQISRVRWQVADYFVLFYVGQRRIFIDFPKIKIIIIQL